MSVEVKKKKEWNHIKRLIVLRWRNAKSVQWLLCFLGVYLVVGLFSLKSLWMSGGYSVDDWMILESYGGFENFTIIVFLGGILFCTGSVLREDSVGMYPGTVMTRYISRILSDWLLLLVFVTGMGLLNLLQTAGYLWMTKATGNFDGVLISAYLGWATLLAFLCILAVYSVILFLQTLYERVGAGRFWIGAGLVMVYVVLEWNTPLCILEIFLGILYHFICQGGDIPVRLAIVSTVVLFVFMVLSFGLVRGIHSWKKDDNSGSRFAFRFLVLFLIYLAFGICFMNHREYNWSGMGDTLEQQVQKGNYLVEDTMQSLAVDRNVCKKLNQSMENLETNLNIEWISLEQAKKAGIVAKDVSLGSQEICIRAVVKNLEVQGTSLTKGFLNAALTVEDGIYRIKQPLKVLIYDNYLHTFTDLFLTDEERDYLSMMRDGGLENFLGYFIIYNAEDIEEDAVPMSMSAGMALGEFDGAIEE